MLTNFADRVERAAAALFGYDATEAGPGRRPPSLTLRSEDAELLPGQRTALVSTTRDLPRNFSIAAWAIRKHLDYVASVVFQPRTGNKDLDKRIKELMGWWGRAENCDACRRHPLWRQIRLAEARATIDGDIGFLKCRSGELQAIEGDRIRNPWGLGLMWAVDGGGGPSLAGWPKGSRLINGVVVNPVGESLGYAIAKRGPFGTQFLPERIVPAKNFLLHAYFERFDQFRGISPLSSALNDFRDIYEAKTYALAKAKLSQLFGVKFTREASDDIGESSRVEEEEAEETEEAEEAAGCDTPHVEDPRRYPVDYGRGIYQLDMDPGDDAAILESHQPSEEFQTFIATMIQIALKSLDIPHCFYDESETAWSSMRSAWIQYEDSAKSKRRNLRDLLDRITIWKLRTFVAAGLLELPPKMLLRDVQWEWLFTGVPWIDPLKEMQADQLAIALRLDSRTHILRQQQREFSDVVAELSDEEEQLEAAGLDASLPNVGTQAGGNEEEPTTKGTKPTKKAGKRTLAGEPSKT
jgi:capsid protein